MVDGSHETTDTPASGLLIRAMRADDVPAVSRIEADCNRFLAEHQGFSERQLSRLLAERCSEGCVRQCFEEFPHHVAVSGGRVVGVLGIEANDVAELWVSPDRHRQGIGRALFMLAEDLIRQAGHSVLTVRTTGYGTPFYEAMGARVVGRRTCGAGPPLEGWVLTCLEKDLGGSHSSQGTPRP